jgi:RNA polymerase sigma-70 factor (ECF subfamily)
MSSLALSSLEQWFHAIADDGDGRLGFGASGRREAEETTDAARVAERNADWLERLGHGDAVAFEAIFHEYYGPIRAFVRSLTHADDTAADVADDVFATMWLHHAELDIRTSLVSYLYRSARNRALNVMRNRRTRARLHTQWLAQDGPAHGGDASRDAEQEELAVMLDRLLAQLSERRREAVTLRWKGGLSHAEIAQVLGITVQSVANLLNRALQDLRRLLPRDFT